MAIGTSCYIEARHNNQAAIKRSLQFDNKYRFSIYECAKRINEESVLHLNKSENLIWKLESFLVIV